MNRKKSIFNLKNISVLLDVGTNGEVKKVIDDRNYDLAEKFGIVKMFVYKNYGLKTNFESRYDDVNSDICEKINLIRIKIGKDYRQNPTFFC